ncbi:MAG: molybdopterin-dependent oxidoreductase, partial [Candidatus Bathyarchaeia archaeon]
VTSIGPKGSLCLMAGLEGIKTVVGQYATSHIPEDLANSRFLLVWGHNPKATSSPFYKFTRKARQAGARMIVVDPVKSETALEADEWLPLKPSTDIALALAMLQVIIDRHLYDADFVEKHTVGFGKFVEHIQRFTPENAAKTCGVDAALIRDTAIDYAAVKPAALLAGMGAQHYTWGYDSLRCLAFLAAVTGNFGVRGGGLYYSTGSYFITYNMEALTLSSMGVSRKEIPPVAVAQHILDAKPTPTRVLFVAGSNPAVQLPHLAKAHAAFDAVGFKVVVDHFMTPTARMADLVLPAASTLEYDDVRNSHGQPYIQMVNKAVNPPDDARTEYEIFGDLAGRLGLKQHFNAEYLQIVDEVLRPTGLTVNMLKQLGFAKAGIPDIPFQDRRFPTPSGKIEFESSSMKTAGLDTLPCFQPPPEGIYSPLNHRYPLVLITHKAYPMLNSQFTSASTSKKPNRGPRLFINPTDASHRGIADGDFVEVSNDRGRCRVKAEVTPRVREGVVVLPTGWWTDHYTEGSYNFLTSDRYTHLGKNAIYNEALVEVNAYDMVNPHSE